MIFLFRYLKNRTKFQIAKKKFKFWKSAISSQLLYVFATVPDSRINSWESWFIFNLRKINTNQYYESDSLNAGHCNMIREYMTLQDDKCI
jgi:hypothetical protein